MLPGRTGSPAGIAVTWPVSVCPYPSRISRPVASRHARSTSGSSASPAATALRRVGSGRGTERFAIARYSVGAMHSTRTRSCSATANRSSGSKRRSCSTAAAPHSHGATNALRADFDQPDAAVHHTTSPGCTPIQCTACSDCPHR